MYNKCLDVCLDLRYNITSKVLLIILLLITPKILLSQENLSGRIIDENNKPVIFANVIVKSRVDSTFLVGCASDSLGQFALSVNNDHRDIILQVRCIGYVEDTLSFNEFVVSNNTILLRENRSLLSEIKVTGRDKKWLSFGNSGLSISIEKSPYKIFHNAESIIKQLPLVSSSGGNYEVLGRHGSPLFYINDRKITNINSELRLLKSSDIKRITIILNPGAEYDPLITSVIKIITKGRIDKGLFGGIYAYGEKGKEFSSYTQANVGWEKDGLNLFFNADYFQNKSYQDQKTSQEIKEIDSKEYVDGDLIFRQKRMKYSLGFGYSKIKNVNFGMRYEYSKRPTARDNQDLTDSVYLGDKIYDIGLSKLIKNESSFKHHVNAYITYRKKKNEFITNIDFVSGEIKSHSQSNVNYENFKSDINSNNTSDYRLFSSKSIYSSPLFAGKLQAGVELSFTHYKNRFIMENQETNIPSNKNTIDQKNTAIFSTYKQSVKEFEVCVGGRLGTYFYEALTDDGKSDKKDSKTTFSPIVSISYDMNKGGGVELGYKRVINKPSYYSLRNNVSFHTPYLYEGGNPFLKDEYVDKLYLNVKSKSKYFELYYKHIKDFRSLLFSPYKEDEPILFIEPENIGTLNSLNALLSYSLSTKYYFAKASALFSNQFLTYDNIKYNDPFVRLKMKNTLILSKTMNMSLSLNYRTKGNSRLSYQGYNFSSDFYFNKKFFKNKLRCSFFVEDIFNTSRECWSLDMQNIYVSKRNYKDTQRIGVTLSLDFDSSKFRYKGGKSSSEIDRL